MKYLNTRDYQSGLDLVIENRVQRLSELRDSMRDSLDNGDDRRLAAAALYHAQADAELLAYRFVLDLLDKHTFELRNTYGRWVCYMEGQEPPPVPCFHLSAKVASLVERTPSDCPASDGLVLMAKLVLATIKTFDDWLHEKEAEYGLFGLNDDGDVDSATKVFQEVTSQFHRMFGRPGFLQDPPQWFREAFAWSYHEEDSHE